MRIERIETVRCRGGESPLWDAQHQALYFIDNSGKKAHRFTPATGETATWDFPSVITTLVLREGGGAVVTLRNGIHFFDFAMAELTAISPLPDSPPFVFNDGKIDRCGRFLIGASTAQFANPMNDGGLYRLDLDLTLVRLDDDIHFSNGPCFSPDDTTLYFSDSWRKTVYAYDYDLEAGAVSGRRQFASTADLGGLPDGATVDRQGLYWVAIYGAGRIAAFRPDGGLERIIDLPVKLVSSLTFGGPNLDQLYVTTMQHGSLGEPVEDGGGYLYRVEGLGSVGVPEPRFAG